MLNDSSLHRRDCAPVIDLGPMPDDLPVGHVVPATKGPARWHIGMGTVATAPGAERLQELAGQCCVLIRRALKTLRAQPDRERRFLAIGTCMPEPVRRMLDAYELGETRAPRFQPSPKDVEIYLEVLSWLTWYEHHDADGPRDVKIIMAIAGGAPVHKIAARHGRSEKTIKRWEAKAYAAMTLRNWQAIERLS